jgi:hypothetical protein
MASELVKELRAEADGGRYGETSRLHERAAARIEALEAALKNIARGEVEVPDDELGSVWVPMSAQEAGEIAHAALSSFTAALEPKGQTNG